MQPFENRYLKLVPNAETTGVLTPSRPPVAQRSAGTVVLNPSLPEPQFLPAVSNFTRSGGDESSFFLIRAVGAPADSNPMQWDLYRGDSSQILGDARERASDYLRFDGGQPLGGAFIYSTQLLQTINEILAQAPLNLARRTDFAAIDRDWLMRILLATYGGDSPQTSDVRLTASVQLPDLGGTPWPLPRAVVAVNRQFAPTSLAANPFPGTGLGTGVRDPVATVTEESSSGGALLVGLGLAALLLLGGNK